MEKTQENLSEEISKISSTQESTKAILVINSILNSHNESLLLMVKYAAENAEYFKGREGFIVDLEKELNKSIDQNKGRLIKEIVDAVNNNMTVGNNGLLEKVITKINDSLESKLASINVELKSSYEKLFLKIAAIVTSVSVFISGIFFLIGKIFLWVDSTDVRSLLEKLNELINKM